MAAKACRACGAFPLLQDPSSFSEHVGLVAELDQKQLDAENFSRHLEQHEAGLLDQPPPLTTADPATSAPTAPPETAMPQTQPPTAEAPTKAEPEPEEQAAQEHQSKMAMNAAHCNQVCRPKLAMAQAERDTQTIAANKAS